jgi:toxin ParE1/3/4
MTALRKCSKKWEVIILEPADRDIQDIGVYFAEYESLDMADAILDRIEEAIDSLASLPDRGRIPPEMKNQSYAFRELQVKPYRVIYEVDKAEGRVNVHLVIDGRRNTAKIMEERLLRPPITFWDDNE